MAAVGAAIGPRTWSVTLPNLMPSQRFANPTVPQRASSPLLAWLWQLSIGEEAYMAPVAAYLDWWRVTGGFFPGTGFMGNFPRRVGRSQVVRHRVLLPPYGGSNPPAPTKRPAQCPRRQCR